MKLALIRHQRSKFSVIEDMEDGLIDALHRHGDHVEAFTLDEDGYTNLRTSIENGEVDCTFAINQMIGKTFFYETYAIPHVCLSIDAFFWDDMNNLAESHIVPCFVDPESTDFCSEVFHKRSFWCPHACSLLPPIQIERDIPFFFPGSYIDEEEMYLLWKKKWGDKVAAEIAESSLQVFSDKKTEYVPFLKSVYEKEVKPRLLEGEDLFISFSRSIDLFLRGCDRANLLTRLEGETVHLATDSKSFQAYATRFPKIRFVDEGERRFSQLFDLFARSQCVLHSMPPILRRGLHERLLYALQFGASIYSSTMEILPSWMRESHVVTFYDQNDPTPQVPSTDIYRRVRSWIEENHTWDVRVRTVVQDAYQGAQKIRSDNLEQDPFLHLHF